MCRGLSSEANAVNVSSINISRVPCVPYFVCFMFMCVPVANILSAKVFYGTSFIRGMFDQNPVFYLRARQQICFYLHRVFD